MNNSSAKKQNRVLLVMLVVVLAAAAILIAVTGSANKKDEKNENPPLDVRITETSAESGKIDAKTAETDKVNAAEDAIASRKDNKSTSDNAKSDDKTESVKDNNKPDEAKSSSADVSDEAAEEVSAVQSAVLPKFSSPVDALVLKDFSADLPVFSCTMNDYRTHSGVDFACSPGTPVSAAADGVICEVVDDPMMGVTVGISHSGGAVTRYKGLSEESMDLVSVGDNVTIGQVIGASGDTALIESAEESHLHFELEVNGESENPGEFMKLTYLTDMVED